MKDTMKATPQLTVGQQLWFVYSDKRRRDPRYVTVAKVGRKYAEVNEMPYKIRLDDLAADDPNYSSPGQCYLSKEAWEAEDALLEAWRGFLDVVGRHWKPPASVTLADIEQARRLLGLGEAS